MGVVRISPCCLSVGRAGLPLVVFEPLYAAEHAADLASCLKLAATPIVSSVLVVQAQQSMEAPLSSDDASRSLVMLFNLHRVPWTRCRKVAAEPDNMISHRIDELRSDIQERLKSRGATTATTGNSPRICPRFQVTIVSIPCTTATSPISRSYKRAPIPPSAAWRRTVSKLCAGVRPISVVTARTLSFGSGRRWGAVGELSPSVENLVYRGLLPRAATRNPGPVSPIPQMQIVAARTAVSPHTRHSQSPF